MIDTAIEQPKPLSLAARECPNRKGGRGVGVATIWRWVQRGVRGIRLETIMVGGTRMTTPEALARFFAEVTAVADSKLTPRRVARQREQAIEAAERELDAATPAVTQRRQ